MHGHFPTNGWGWAWVGDPDRGVGRSQPGGWLFNILPFIEQNALSSLAADGQPDSITNQQRTNALAMVQTPLQFMNCPSRRGAELFDKRISGIFVAYNSLPIPITNQKLARADYAANMGTIIIGDLPGPVAPSTATSPMPPSPSVSEHNGLMFAGSLVKHAEVFDGTTQTYLLGEKYLNPDHYTTGWSMDDNENWATGANNDNSRSGLNRPMRDRAGLDLSGAYVFGGPHAAGFQMAMVDGSVQNRVFLIEASTHLRLSNRMDGNWINSQAQ